MPETDTRPDVSDKPLIRSPEPPSDRWYRDLSVGLSDGLIVPLALTAGLQGAQVSAKWIVAAGLAQLSIGAIAIGFGRYFTGREKDDHNHHHHHGDWEENKADTSIRETELPEMNLSEEARRVIREEMARDRAQWSELTHSPDSGAESPEQLRSSAIRTGATYALAGLIPVLPYFFLDNSQSAFRCSVVVTLLCLAVFGAMGARSRQKSPVAGALRQVIGGSVAAAAMYGIAQLFR